MRETHDRCDGYAVVMERERLSLSLYRELAAEAKDPEAKMLIERLVHRTEAYLEKLETSKRRGSFLNKPCNLTDNAFHSTISVPEDRPGLSVPEILMYAIVKRQEGSRFCEERSRHCHDEGQKDLWRALAEEERTHRLELEAYYQMEVIGRI